MLSWLSGGFGNLRLDIVGFLAILGEASVIANAQVSFLSYLALLPRLLPAPQALIRSTRPENLKSNTGQVLGACSGSVRHYVNHIAHLIHSRERLEAYAVRCERITKPNRDATVSAKTFGPLGVVRLLGAVMSLTLFILSIKRNDGFALLATILLSALSTLIGLGSRWKLKLMKRKGSRRVPKDNIVITYPHGAFLIVKCDEETARELYWHPEECDYRFGDTVYRLISLVGTLMLMFGVICLGNSTLYLQIGFAAAYMILNVAYWIVAALPAQWHWDLSCYAIEREIYEGDEKQSTFTLALWRAIAISQSAEWVKNGQIAPVSRAWKQWVDKAGDMVGNEMGSEEAPTMGRDSTDSLDKGGVKPLPVWDPEQALTDYLDPSAKGLNV